MKTTFKDFLIYESTKVLRKIVYKWNEQSKYKLNDIDTFIDKTQDFYHNNNIEMIVIKYYLDNGHDISPDLLDKILQIMDNKRHSYQDVIKSLNTYVDDNSDVEIKEKIDFNKIDGINLFRTSDDGKLKIYTLDADDVTVYSQNELSNIDSNDISSELEDKIIELIGFDGGFADIEELRQNLRHVINVQYGKNTNPWCLLSAKDGILNNDSMFYWYCEYNAFNKMIATYEDKLVSFFASDYEEMWWDLQDKATQYVYKKDNIVYYYYMSKIYKIDRDNCKVEIGLLEDVDKSFSFEIKNGKLKKLSTDIETVNDIFDESDIYVDIDKINIPVNNSCQDIEYFRKLINKQYNESEF